MSDYSESDSETLPYSCKLCDLVTEGLAAFELHISNVHFADKEKKPNIMAEEKLDKVGKVVVSKAIVVKEASDAESMDEDDDDQMGDNVSDWEEENVKSNYYDEEDSDGMEESECEGQDLKKKVDDDSDGMEETECKGKVKREAVAQVSKPVQQKRKVVKDLGEGSHSLQQNDGDNVIKKSTVKRRGVKQVGL